MGVVASDAEQDQGLAPKLRFPEFRDVGPWPSVPLRSLAKRKTKRNADEEIIRVLTNSAEHGVVDQKDYFEKDIAVQGNLEAYFVVDLGDYVYNPRISSMAPVGPIGKNKVGIGVMSPLYTVFGFNADEDGFYEQFFRSSLWHSHMRLVSNSGARHDRMAVSTADFMDMPVPAPMRVEQQKIADCLSSLDAVIAAEGDRLAALKAHKKGLMQALFPALGQTTPRLRFPEFQEAGEWEERSLSEISDVAQGFGFPDRLQGKSSGDYPFCKVSDVSRAVTENGGLLNSAANYVDHADLTILRAKTIPTGATVFAKIGEALRLNRRAITGVTCLIDNNAVALKANKSEVTAYFLFSLSQTIDMNDYCAGSVPSVNKSTLEAIVVRAPGLNEQTKIAAYIQSLDALIDAQRQRIDALKVHKSGLMQQLLPSPIEAVA